MKKEDQEQPSEVFKLLWNLKVPPSAVVCVWRLLMDRLPTRSNLVKRGLQLPNLLCPFCQECVESAQRLFVTCKVTQKVQNQCERWVGIVTVRHESIIVHFHSSYLFCKGHYVNKALKGMWVAIVLEIWNQKNKVVFDRGGLWMLKKFLLLPS